MVGLSDIPCVGVALDRISNATVDAGIRGLKYMLCYKGLLKNLDSEIKNVSNEEEDVARKAQTERDSGKTIKNHVVEWQNEVTNIKAAHTALSRERPSCSCFNVMQLPNPVSRFRMGRKAAHTADDVVKLVRTGQKLAASEIAYLQNDEDIPLSNTTTYQTFDSRQEAYGKLWHALVEGDGNSVLGIYGMPGTGKTKMMEQASKDAKDKKIFDTITRANVGREKMDVIELQKQLARSLNCRFESEDDKVQRASQLKKSIMNAEGKTLVILDDVWDQIHFNEIGIPFLDNSFKDCKILLTSRKQDVCLRNNCKAPIEIKPLTVKEAWDMFKITVGISTIESLQDKLLAEKVCKECACLPLLIAAVGNALKILPETSWKGALDQLENSEIQNVPGLESIIDLMAGRSVYVCLKLSFDKLNKDAKACLLLCSLFPEDAEIKIDVLFDIGTASLLLNGGKERLYMELDVLQSSSLLLQGGDHNSTVKVHDIVRDVARSIAATDPEYAFLFIRGHSRLPKKGDYSDRELIHFMEIDNVRFPDYLVCPNLRTLWLQSNNGSRQFSVDLIQVFTSLRVLLLKGMNLTQQQFSIHTLVKLKMLILDGCDVDETFLNTVSKKLEILCIWECTLQTPLGLPDLRELRKLEVLCPTNIAMMPNAISSLCSLEELNIPNGFEIRDAAESSHTSISAELNQLTGLTKLVMSFVDCKSCPNEKIVRNLIDFHICVGKLFFGSRPTSKRSIWFQECYIEGGGKALLETAEEVILNKVDIPENIQPLPFFSNLSVVNIQGCQGLKFLFSASVIKCLVHMQNLSVEECPMMEEIVRGSTDDQVINFPNLKSLNLMDLPSLTSFYNEDENMISSTTTLSDNIDTSFHVQSYTLFGEKVAMPFLEELEMDNIEKISEIWKRDDNSKDNCFSRLKSIHIFCCNKLESVITLHRLQNLEMLKISHCESLRNVFHNHSMARDLVNLQTLSFSNCRSMTEIIGKGGEIINTGLVFPGMTEINLFDLPSLESFWYCDPSPNFISQVITFPNLEIFRVYSLNCSLTKEIEVGTDDSTSKLEKLELYYEQEVEFPSQWKLQLQNLKSLELRNCWWPAGDSLFKSGGAPLIFQRLEILVLKKCRVSTLFTSSVSKSFQQLTKLKISDCDLLEEIVEEVNGDNISFPLLESLILVNLPNLKAKGISACNMPALEEVDVHNCGVLSNLFGISVFRNLQQLQSLEVSNCPLLEDIVEDDETPGTSEKTISLIRLKSITLERLPSLKSFCGNSTFACNMPALENVEVINCGLSNLFGISVFRNLQQLQRLEVSRCTLLEDIVEDDESPGTSEKTISLIRLESIKLEHLPILKSFCRTSTYAFNMPALKFVTLFGCPCMDNFTSLPIKAPSLSFDHASRLLIEESEDDSYSHYDDDESKDDCYRDSEVDLVRPRPVDDESEDDCYSNSEVDLIRHRPVDDESEDDCYSDSEVDLVRPRPVDDESEDDCYSDSEVDLVRPRPLDYD